MIRHVSGLAEIVEDVSAAVHFYREVLGLQVEYEEGTAYAQVQASGALHFGLWRREDAAATVFGDVSRAAEIPLGFNIGFEVDEVEKDTNAAEGRGLAFIQSPKTEPWGQVTSRFFSPSGALCEFSETPWARRILKAAEVEPPVE